MTKDTSKLVEELGLCDEFRTFYDENKDYMISQELHDMLLQLVWEKGLQKAPLFRKAEISEIYGYQIFSGARLPDRKKLLCLAVAMELNVEEVQTLLRCAGYAPLYVRRPADSVVLYGICQKMSLPEINAMLFEYGQETLG